METATEIIAKGLDGQLRAGKVAARGGAGPFWGGANKSADNECCAEDAADEAADLKGPY